MQELVLKGNPRFQGNPRFKIIGFAALALGSSALIAFVFHSIKTTSRSSPKISIGATEVQAQVGAVSANLNHTARYALTSKDLAFMKSRGVLTDAEASAIETLVQK